MTSMFNPEGSLWKIRDCPIFSSYGTRIACSWFMAARGLVVILLCGNVMFVKKIMLVLKPKVAIAGNFGTGKPNKLQAVFVSAIPQEYIDLKPLGVERRNFEEFVGRNFYTKNWAGVLVRAHQGSVKVKNGAEIWKAQFEPSLPAHQAQLFQSLDFTSPSPGKRKISRLPRLFHRRFAPPRFLHSTAILNHRQHWPERWCHPSKILKIGELFPNHIILGNALN